MLWIIVILLFMIFLALSSIFYQLIYIYKQLQKPANEVKEEWEFFNWLRSHKPKTIKTVHS